MEVVGRGGRRPSSVDNAKTKDGEKVLAEDPLRAKNCLPGRSSFLKSEAFEGIYKICRDVTHLIGGTLIT